MSGFLAKLRIITLGNVHDLLDKTIDLNSPSAVRQYVRDIEDALDTMKDQAVTMAGTVRTLKREKGETDLRIKTLEGTIQHLVAAGHEDVARPKATELVRLRQQFAQADANIATAQNSANDIDSAVAKLDAKHADMVARVHELERLDQDTKAKNEAARAMTAAGKLLQGGSNISVDDVESRMRKQNDVAQERFSRALGDTAVQEDADTAAAVDNVLAEFKKPQIGW